MSSKLDGKVALVTGGGSGIGRATALAFANDGARVVVADRTKDQGQETVEIIKTSGGEALFVETDVSKSDEVNKLVESTISAYGRLDYAHNNAGIFPGLFPLPDYPEEVWDNSLDIMCKGVWLCMKYEIPRMLDTGGGAIVNTSSIAGLIGFPNHYAYTAAKYGVNGLTKVAAMEFAKSGVRVNAICPGLIETPMGEAFKDLAPIEALIALHPIGRFGTPEEVASTVLWLCSEHASFITGQIIAVDGGWSVP